MCIMQAPQRGESHLGRRLSPEGRLLSSAKRCINSRKRIFYMYFIRYLAPWHAL